VLQSGSVGGEAGVETGGDTGGVDAAIVQIQLRGAWDADPRDRTIPWRSGRRMSKGRERKKT
jgi:hypothetical protein